MGAGSAKGANPDNEDADRFSTSSDQWEKDDIPVSKVAKENAKNNNTTVTKAPTIASTKIVAEAAIASTSNAEINADAEDKKDDAKKKTRFGFGRKKDDAETKADDIDDKKETAEKDAKNATDKKGFKLFGWRKDEKKPDEKDEALDDDIDDLEKTFDSLGIVGKNMWGNDQPINKKNEKTVDDIELLEPMRKRKNVRVRGGPGNKGGVTNGAATGSSGSNGSKRTFKFSWENQGGEKPSTKEEEDEWEYKAVVIEGFDIEKFRKANNKDSVFDSTSLPNAVGGGENEAGGATSPLRYDQSEQYILASIERDFTH